MNHSNRHRAERWSLSLATALLAGWCAAASAARAEVTGDAVGQAPDATPELQRARVSLDRGEALFNAGNYEAALSEFSNAYALMRGHARRFVVLHNIALCHERLFRYDLALRFYDRYLEEGAGQATDRAEVAAAANSLRRLLAIVRISSNLPAQVWIGERMVGDAPGDVLVPPGTHLIELRAPRLEPARQTVQAIIGTTVRAAFELNPLSQFLGLDPSYFWIGASLSVAAIATGAVLGVRALATRSRAEDKARRGLSVGSERERFEQQALAADVSFATAGVLLAGSVVLFFVTDWDRRSSERVRAQLTLLGSATAQVGISGAMAP